MDVSPRTFPLRFEQAFRILNAKSFAPGSRLVVRSAYVREAPREGRDHGYHSEVASRSAIMHFKVHTQEDVVESAIRGTFRKWKPEPVAAGLE